MTGWVRSIPDLATRIQQRLATATPAAKAAGCTSFDTYVKQLLKVLSYVDRYYTKRMSLPDTAHVAAPVQAQLRASLGAQ